VYDPHAAAPRTWEAAFGAEVPLSRHVRFSLDLSGTTGDGQPALTDLNLVRTPRFVLADEGNRPVFAPPTAIDPTTGAVSPLGSRWNSSFGQVLSYSTSLHSETAQAAVGLTASTVSGGMLALTYMRVAARDQALYPTPLAATWGRAANDGAQQLAAAISWPLGHDAALAVNARANGGTRFTPSVNTDVTAAGISATPAFIFDPVIAAARGDTVVATGMRALLAHAPSSARACLASELGHLAERNACVGPWSATLDAQLRVQPSWSALARRLTLIASVSNLLSGIDALAHGPNHLAGWGAPASPDPTLLYVEGFDPITETYRYAVNPRFGSATTSRVLRQSPSALTLEAQFVVGGRGRR
jgi:hypothetical protein